MRFLVISAIQLGYGAAAIYVSWYHTFHAPQNAATMGIRTDDCNLRALRPCHCTAGNDRCGTARDEGERCAPLRGGRHARWRWRAPAQDGGRIGG